MNHPSAGCPTSAAAARAVVKAVLTGDGRDLDAPDAVDALLVVTELVTNAIRHGGAVTYFEARIESGFLRLVVGDTSTAHPVTRTSLLGRMGGYGWPLIRRLAEEVTVVSDPAGKRVTAVLKMP
ncbi:ATP-binding protein [Streptomyces sp. NPDC048551]|uniref:ATP-binding protein n=1 Tax=Streptomyces sp. NPDC048551 TaxID=3155758 RepID=UPI0034441D3B